MSRSGNGMGGGGGFSGSAGTNRQHQQLQPNPKYSVQPILSSTVEQPNPLVNVDEDSFRDAVGDQFAATLMPPNHGLSPNLIMTSSKSPPTAQPMSMAVLMLIVVASLSLVVGMIYLLIYFKSIKPMSARSRSYADPGGGKGDDDGGARKSAGHPFFRRK